MDLRLAARVLWRFKLLVVAGLLVAAGLAVLSFAHVSFAGGHLKLTYRKPQIWQSQTNLLLTQAGFPYGNAVQNYVPSNVQGGPPTPAGDTARLAGLATLYAELANGDYIRAKVLGAHPDPNGPNIVTTAGGSTAGSGSPLLPVMTITATAYSEQTAKQLGNKAMLAFRRYLVASQDAAGISAGNRVLVEVLNGANSDAKVVKGRKKTLPIIVFLVVALLTAGLAFGLENLRPQVVVTDSIAGRKKVASGAIAGES